MKLSKAQQEVVDKAKKQYGWYFYSWEECGVVVWRGDQTESGKNIGCFGPYAFFREAKRDLIQAMKDEINMLKTGLNKVKKQKTAYE